MDEIEKQVQTQFNKFSSYPINWGRLSERVKTKRSMKPINPDIKIMIDLCTIKMGEKYVHEKFDYKRLEVTENEALEFFEKDDWKRWKSVEVINFLEPNKHFIDIRSEEGQKWLKKLKEKIRS